MRIAHIMFAIQICANLIFVDVIITKYVSWLSLTGIFLYHNHPTQRIFLSWINIKVQFWVSFGGKI